jgi:CHASE3 domain sensor protein
MSISTRLWCSAAVVLAVFATVAALMFWTVGAMDRAASARRDAREFLLQVELVLSDLRDAETGQRGYLLTGAESYLASFGNVIHTLPGRLNELKLASSAAGQLRSKLARLEELSKEKLEELQETVALRRDRGFEAANKVVMTDRGKQLMDQAREVVSEIEAIQRATIDSGWPSCSRSMPASSWGLSWAVWWWQPAFYWSTG